MLIAHGVHQVPHIRGANVFLLEDSQGLTLVDSGLPGNTAAILRYVHKLGHGGSEATRLLLTHGHPDHTGSARAIRAATGAAVHAHGEDCTQGVGARTVRMVGLPDPLRPLPWRCPVDEALVPGATLPLLGGLTVIGTPGHTPGSVCLLSQREGVLFIGDLVSRRNAYISRSVPFPETDLDQYHASMEKIAALPFETVCFGHGPAVSGRAANAVRDIARWYREAPWWRRRLQSIPGPLRLGVEAGYRLPLDLA